MKAEDPTLTFVSLFDIENRMDAKTEAKGQKKSCLDHTTPHRKIPLLAVMATEGYDDEAKGSEVNNPMMSPQIHRRGTMLLNADGELDTTARSGTTQQHEDVDDEGGESDDESDNDSYFDSNERRRDPSDFAAEAKASRRLSVQEKGEKVRPFWGEECATTKCRIKEKGKLMLPSPYRLAFSSFPSLITHSSTPPPLFPGLGLPARHAQK